MHRLTQPDRHRPRDPLPCFLTALIRRLAAGALVCLCNGPLHAAIELTQADGSTLALPRPAGTLITLAPHLTELAFAAGAGRQLIATVEYSDYPAEAASIPRIGDAFKLDLERILTLKPDLVIAWQSGNPATAVDYLQNLGIATWTVEIRRPEEIAGTLEAMGGATGNVEAARLAAQSTREQLDRIKDRYAGSSPVPYFYQVTVHPLYTINGSHLISRSLALCGGQNIFEHAAGLAPQVARESVIAANPRALIAPLGPSQPDPLAAWRYWPGIPAVQTGSLILLPEDEISQATPRLLDAIETACMLLNQTRTGRPDD